RDEISREVEHLKKTIFDETSLEIATRDRDMQRLALVDATTGNASRLADTVLALPPSLDVNTMRADRAATRWSTAAMLLAMQDKYEHACNAMNFAADRLGEKNRTLVAAPMYLRRALLCRLANSIDSERHVAAARQALPETIPKTHRLWRVLEHIERVAQAKHREDIVLSQRQLARELNVHEVANLHPSLPGMLF
ncbi:MAG: hypothetical protein ACRDAM_01265, partial [Casimicrobium sp.]